MRLTNRIIGAVIVASCIAVLAGCERSQEDLRSIFILQCLHKASHIFEGARAEEVKACSEEADKIFVRKTGRP